MQSQKERIRPLTFNNSRFYHTCSSLGRDAEIMSYAARTSTSDPKQSGVETIGLEPMTILRAKQVLSQLSYAPKGPVCRFHAAR